MAPIPRTFEPYKDNKDEEELPMLAKGLDDIEKNVIPQGSSESSQETTMDDEGDSIVYRDDAAQSIPTGLMFYCKRPYDIWRVRWHAMLLMASLVLFLFVTGTVRWPWRTSDPPSTMKVINVHPSHLRPSPDSKMPQQEFQATEYFSAANFSLVQVLGRPDDYDLHTHMPVMIRGRVDVVERDHAHSADVEVELSYTVSQVALTGAVSCHRTEEGLRLVLPAFIRISDWERDYQPTIDVTARVHVKPRTALNRLQIQTTGLDIRFLAGEATTWTVHDFLAKSYSGNIYTSGRPRLTGASPLPSSRQISIITTSGQIGGDFDLLDLLYLRSERGKIRVDVDARAAVDPEKPDPAKFIASTISGDISANMFPRTLERVPPPVPDREYHIRVATESGSVTGLYFLGHDTNFSTKSGSIAASFRPVAPFDARTRFVTKTESGSCYIRVLPPIQRPGKLRWTDCQHMSRSGAIRLRYPSQWEGNIGVESTSGSIDVSGSRMRIVGRGPNFVEARRGHGYRSLTCQSGSGDVNVRLS
ncbi:MAG: hypothetical protein M1823_003858 [Watsoniomyces obsoletus]|nr:MAG: hypothetical protein M1823_003858 [Watsoniomyces obsoletus]